MTITELIDLLLPITLFGLAILLMAGAVYVIIILIRVKRILDRLETLSDVAGWISLLLESGQNAINKPHEIITNKTNIY